jgi:hypothetical protein
MHDERNEGEESAVQDRLNGAPGGARQNVRRETAQGAVARPGGATQNSGGSLESMDEEAGQGPARGAD